MEMCCGAIMNFLHENVRVSAKLMTFQFWQFIALVIATRDGKCWEKTEAKKGPGPVKPVKEVMCGCRDVGELAQT